MLRRVFCLDALEKGEPRPGRNVLASRFQVAGASTVVGRYMNRAG